MCGRATPLRARYDVAGSDSWASGSIASAIGAVVGAASAFVLNRRHNRRPPRLSRRRLEYRLRALENRLAELRDQPPREEP